MSDQFRAHVLVVDDDPQLLSLLVDTLTAIGYEVTGAPGGIEALDTLTTRKFDLMVTDIKMPNLDGIQLLKRVRRHYPDMPVIFITGVVTPEIISHAAPDGFLAKPFRIHHIEQVIEATLRGKKDNGSHSLHKVLIVEPDRDFRESLTDTLNHSNYIPIAAAGIPEAVLELENGTFDAVIAELNLPRFEGREFAEILQEQFPSVPLILMSGNKTSEELIESRYARFIQKPFTAGRIIQLLNETVMASASF
jgi:DNA-binding NtrC family response regulator